MFIKLRKKIKRAKIKKLLNDNWVRNFLNQKIKKYFPGAKKITNLKIEILRNFLGKFRNITARYSLIIDFGQREKKKNILVKINTLNLGPIRWMKAVKILEKHGFKKLPRILEYLPSFNTLFYEEIEGISLQEMFNKQHISKIIKIIPGVAKLLRKIHGLKIRDFFIIKNRKEEKREYRHWLFLVRKCLPRLEKRFKKAYYSLIEFQEKNKNIFLLEKDYILTHGDFHLGNVVLNKNKLAIVDFGDAELYDPSNDVAGFLAQTESMLRYYLPKKLVFYQKKIENFFLRNYFKKEPDQTEKIRLTFFKTRCFLQMAAILSFVTWPPKDKILAMKKALNLAEGELNKLPPLLPITRLALTSKSESRRANFNRITNRFALPTNY